jgi:hypothetical protein
MPSEPRTLPCRRQLVERLRETKVALGYPQVENS